MSRLCPNCFADLHIGEGHVLGCREGGRPPRTQAITPARLRYIAADFICNADHPLHRERLKALVRSALEKAADELEHG